jgi:hypothetical protein
MCLPNLDLKLGIGPKQGISYLERKRGRGERETEKEAREREIEGRNRKIEVRDMQIVGRNRKREGRDKETEKQRDRADNKNPKHSWVAQLVTDKNLPYNTKRLASLRS